MADVRYHTATAYAAPGIDLMAANHRDNAAPKPGAARVMGRICGRVIRVLSRVAGRQDGIQAR